MTSELSVPDFDNSEEIHDMQAEQHDWEEEPKYVSFKSEHDVHAKIIVPYTKSSYNIGKGLDSNGVLRTGYIPTGFSEANTPDLTTANLQVDSIPKNLDERYIFAINTCLANLINMYKITGIDVRPSYEMMLLRRDLYNSMTKARKGKLLEYSFVKKSDISQTRTDNIRTQTQKKKTLKDKIFGSGEAEEY